MSVTQQTPTTTEQASAPEPVPSSRRADVTMALLSVAGAFYLTSGFWLDPYRRVSLINSNDQALFEWLFAYAADTLRNGRDPFWTTLLNAPHGANLAVNTAESVVGWLLAPITLLFGPTMTFLVALTFAVAATPFAWYLLLSRRLVTSRAAAVVGGLFCGFAPGLVAHANGHVNFASGYLVPLIVWRVLELRHPGRVLRNGALLGVLVAVQFSLGGETLFFAALACGVFLGCWLMFGHREPREHVVAFVRGLAVTAAVTFTLLSYPLWLMFFGPQNYHGTTFDQTVHNEDLLAYGAFPHRSLAGALGLGTRLAPNTTEENSFFGVPLLVVLVGVTVLLLRRGDRARRALTAALAATALVFAVLSLGPRLKVDGYRSDVPLPYAALADLPLFDAALPARLALVVTAVFGVLLALALDTPLPRRRLVAAAVALGLLPLVPTPLLTMERSGVPHFVTSGAWRDHLRPGQVLVPVPPTSDVLPDGQRWQAATLSQDDGSTFRIPAGFFLGPGGPDGRGRIGPVPRPTYAMLREVALTGVRPAITDADRAQAREDLRFWDGRVVVLPDPGTGNRWDAHHGALLATVVDLLGPGTRVDDVWLWPI